MPITHPPKEDDFVIFFKGTQFNISKCFFGLYSFKFKSDPRFVSNSSIDMSEEGIDILSFSEFVKACQGQFYMITIKNAFDLCFLCEKWEVPAINNEVNSFISQMDNFEIVLAKLEFLIKRNESIDELEIEIAKKIDQFLPNPSFANLPIPVLCKIISKVEKDNFNHQLYSIFLENAFKIHNDSSSILLSFADAQQCSRSQIQIVMEKANENNMEIPSKFTNSIDSLFKILDEHTQQINLISSNINDAKELEDKNNQEFNQKIHRLKKSLNKKVKNISVEGMVTSTSMQSLHGIEQDMDNINANLNKNNSTISDLESRCSDLDNLYNDILARLNTMKQEHTKQAAYPPPKAEKKKKSRISVFVPRKLMDNPPRGQRKTASMKEPDHKHVSFVEPTISISHTTKKAYNGVDKLNGVINYLTQKYGNVVDAEIIGIDSALPGNQNLKNICSYDWSFCWASKDTPGQWVRFDFKAHTIKVDNYSIKTCPYKANFHHLKNWVLEGSMDGEKWDELDKREENSELNYPAAIAIFDCNSKGNFYRYIRLHSIGPNHYGKFILAFTNIEFFGTLKGS